jgi:hypothetical protein
MLVEKKLMPYGELTALVMSNASGGTAIIQHSKQYLSLGYGMISSVTERSQAFVSAFVPSRIC